MHQLAWLNQTLAQIYSPRSKVIILAHHPEDDWNYLVRQKFTQIIAAYPSSFFMGMMHGHTHMNEFFTISDSNNQDKLTAFVGGSLTTTGIISNGALSKQACGYSGNPGFNIFRYNRTSGQILDLEYWWYDLTKVNQEDVLPRWEKQYSAKEAYQMMGMTVQDWSAAKDKINNNARLQKLYNLIWAKGLP